ncbi:MAG: DUF4157 domain-containing protein [Fimbriimonadales bacterium]
MGLSDLASGFADAVSDGVSSIASAPSKAISFAKGVADKAEGFVEQTVGPQGMAVLHSAADLIPNPFGILPAGLSAISDALADPLGFVMGIVDKAESTGMAALHFAENSIGSLVRTSLSGINVLLQGSLGVVKLLARGAINSFRLVAKDFVTSFTFALSGLRAAGMGLLRFEGKMTKAAFQVAANINKALIHSWKLRIRDLIVTTGTKIQNATTAISEPVVRRATELSQSLHRKATFIVSRVLPTALTITGQVMVAANKANQTVQSAITKAAPFVPSGLSWVTQRIGNFTKNLADKSNKLFLFVGVKLTPAVMRAYVTLETQVIPMINQVAATANQIRAEVFDQVNTRGLQALFFLDRIERQLDEKIDAINKTVQGKVDLGIETLDSTLGAALTQANQMGTQAAQGAGDFVAGLEQKGEAAADGAAQDVKKATTPGPDGSIPIVKSAKAFAGRVGEAALNFAGDVGRGAIELGGRLLDPATRLSQARQPHDGELTGPFFPGTPMANENQVAGLHGQGAAAEREGAIASGANIFVNGIDTTLADHYRAAQRLANTLNVTVVGVYNASGGMGTDLVQCAADKFFDRSGNPAVATMSRLIRTYGDARKPNGGMHIFAHSQGSLIVSEALRQAQRTGADLRGNDVTTFGNAAFTYPAGPQYHHYIHDDDAVAGSVGTGSLISGLMNNTGIGRALSGAFLGPTADVQATTTTLHHGGGGIEPHAVNAPGGHDYIGDLGAFRAQEARQRPVGPAAPIWQRTMEASGFALARAGGSAASGAVASRYGSLDTGIRSLPSLPGLPPNSLWGMADRGLRSFGGAISSFGNRLGAQNDASFNALDAFQPAGFAGASRPSGKGQIASKSPDSGVRARPSPGLAGAGLQSGPVATSGFSSAGAAVGSGIIQRSGHGSAPDVDPESLRRTLVQKGGPGSAPAGNIRGELSGHLGFDPSEARLHAGPHSAAAARGLQAEAFTIGRDVFFGEGKLDPSSRQGLGLIAHELTHVGQQTGTTGDKARFYTQSGGDAMEKEAQQTAERFLVNEHSPGRLVVEHCDRQYEAEQGSDLTEENRQRLDSIYEQALRLAEEMLASKGNRKGIRVETLDIQISLDLTRMTDAEAARIWATAIVDSLPTRDRNAPQPKQAVPLPARLQKAPDDPAPTGTLPGEDVYRMYPDGVTMIFYRKHVPDTRTLDFSKYTFVDQATLLKDFKIDSKYPDMAGLLKVVKAKGSRTDDWARNDRNFPDSAHLHAKLIHPIGLKGGNILWDGDNEMLGWQDVDAGVKALSEKLKTLYSDETFLKKFPGTDTKTTPPWKIKQLLIYTHGDQHWLGTGAQDHAKDLSSGGAHGDLNKFVDGMKDYLTPDVNVALMACLTGKEDNQGEGSFADVLRDLLVEKGLKQARVMGHMTAEEASSNPHLRIFDGALGTTGGTTFFDYAFPAVDKMFEKDKASTTKKAKDAADYQTKLNNWYDKYCYYWFTHTAPGYPFGGYYNIGLAAMLVPSTAAAVVRQAFDAATSFSDYSFEPIIDLHQLGPLQNVTAALSVTPNKDYTAAFAMLNGRSMADMLDLMEDLNRQGLLVDLQSHLDIAEKTLGKGSRDRLSYAMQAVIKGNLDGIDVDKWDIAQGGTLKSYVAGKTAKGTKGTAPLARSALDGHSPDGGAMEAMAQRIGEGVMQGRPGMPPAGGRGSGPMLQMQKIKMGSGRNVGDTPGPMDNLREEVILAMDRMHTLWDMTNDEYAADYGRIVGLPGGSQVAAFPGLLAAITRNESATLNPATALYALGLTIGANVGAGQPNNKADILALQDALHSAWFITNADYATERAAIDAVTTAAVPEGTIGKVIQGIAALKAAIVAGNFVPGVLRRDTYAGTHAVTPTQHANVEQILTPGATLVPAAPPPPGGVAAPPVVVGPPPMTDAGAGGKLETDMHNQMKASMLNFANDFRTRKAAGATFPIGSANDIANAAQDQVEKYYAPYIRVASRAPSGTYHPGAYSLTSILGDQSTRPIGEFTGPDASGRPSPGRVNWMIYFMKQFGDAVLNRYHCVPSRSPDDAEFNRIRDLIANDATMKTDIEDAIHGWPAEATGGVFIQPYQPMPNPTAALGVRWDTFTTLMHEMMHILEHPNHQRTRAAIGGTADEILKEGMADVMRYELWEGPGNMRANVASAAMAPLRTRVEGATLPYNAAAVRSHGYYGVMAEARQIVNQVGIENAKVAFFMGHTELLGLGAGTAASGGSLAGIGMYSATDSDDAEIVVARAGDTVASIQSRTNAPAGGIVDTTTGTPVAPGAVITAGRRLRVPGIRYVYAIQEDTLGSIANQNAISFSELARVNGLPGYTPETFRFPVGTRVLIPIHTARP